MKTTTIYNASHRANIVKALNDTYAYLGSALFIKLVHAIRYNDDTGNYTDVRNCIKRARLACIYLGISGYYPVHAIVLYAIRHKGHWLKESMINSLPEPPPTKCYVL